MSERSLVAVLAQEVIDCQVPAEVRRRLAGILRDAILDLDPAGPCLGMLRGSGKAVRAARSVLLWATDPAAWQGREAQRLARMPRRPC